MGLLRPRRGLRLHRRGRLTRPKSTDKTGAAARKRRPLFFCAEKSPEDAGETRLRKGMKVNRMALGDRPDLHRIWYNCEIRMKKWRDTRLSF